MHFANPHIALIIKHLHTHKQHKQQQQTNPFATNRQTNKQNIAKQTVLHCMFNCFKSYRCVYAFVAFLLLLPSRFLVYFLIGLSSLLSSLFSLMCLIPFCQEDSESAFSCVFGKLE